MTALELNLPWTLHEDPASPFGISLVGANGQALHAPQGLREKDIPTTSKGDRGREGIRHNRCGLHEQGSEVHRH